MDVNLKTFLIVAYRDHFVKREKKVFVGVDITVNPVTLPTEYATSDGFMLLDVRAVEFFKVANNVMSFDAWFAKVRTHVVVPVGSIVSIYDVNEPTQRLTFEAERQRLQPALKLVQ